MTSARSGLMLTLFVATILVTGCAGMESAGPSGTAAVAAKERPAVGSVEDSLKACLARIPKDASAGQRMFAEESCQRDEQNRKAIQAVPGK